MRNQGSLGLAAAFIALGVAFAGCGGGDSGSSSKTTPKECYALCDAQTAGGCALLASADCKQFCDALYGSVSKACQDTWEAASKCERSQPNVCDTNAVNTACKTQSDAAKSCT